jgi:hypothetical protein
LADPNYISPSQGAQALITTLEMAEMHEQWSLMEAVLDYIRKADGHVFRMGPSNYLVQYPKEN